jgi:hypothetical protein
MRRRDFITLLGGPTAVRAAQRDDPQKPERIEPFISVAQGRACAAVVSSGRAASSCRDAALRRGRPGCSTSGASEAEINLLHRASRRGQGKGGALPEFTSRLTRHSGVLPNPLPHPLKMRFSIILAHL